MYEMLRIVLLRLRYGIRINVIHQEMPPNFCILPYID